MPKGQAKQAIKTAASKKKEEEQKKKKKHHSKAKPDAKHSSGGGKGGGGGGKSKPKATASKDADSRQKSFEHHMHGREVLPQLQKHEPKTKPESRDDLLGATLAAEEKQHKLEHHHHHHPHVNKEGARHHPHDVAHVH